LRALLKKLGWRQTELCARTRISAAVINRYYKGERQIHAKHAFLIATATGLTTDYILYGSVRNLTFDEIKRLPERD